MPTVYLIRDKQVLPQWKPVYELYELMNYNQELLNLFDERSSSNTCQFLSQNLILFFEFFLLILRIKDCILRVKLLESQN